MIKTIGCVECGEAVPYGRLSCPVCGALLASVAGARRGFVRIDENMVEPGFSRDPEPAEALMAVAVADAPAVTEAPVAMAVTEAVVADAPVAMQAVQALIEAPAAAQPALLEDPAVVQAAAVAPAAVQPAIAEVQATAQIVATIDEAPIEQVPAQMEYLTVADPVPAPETPSFSVDPEPETPWAPLVQPQPTLIPRPYRRQLAFAYDDGGTPARLPSAYRPPTLAPSFATATASVAGPTWSSVAPVAAARNTSTPLETGDAIGSIRGLMDAARFVEIAGWFIIVGATMSVLGFLLPWSRTVIGSNGLGGYFAAWGLASPTHSVVLLGLLVVLGLAVVRTRIPAWARTGVAGLALGGLLVGLAWPYLFGPLGADVGVTVTVLGGLALMIGGGVASWATRHAGTDLLV